jgi:hypothetical protein
MSNIYILSDKNLWKVITSGCSLEVRKVLKYIAVKWRLGTTGTVNISLKTVCIVELIVESVELLTLAECNGSNARGLTGSFRNRASVWQVGHFST